MSDDGKYAAWADQRGSLHVRGLETGRVIVSSGVPATMPFGLDFIPGTHELVFASVVGDIVVWDVGQAVTTGQKLPLAPVAEAGNWKTVHLKLAPNGRWLRIQRGRTIEIWDLASRQRLVTLPPAADLPWSLGWSADGRRLAIGYANGRVAVWDLEAVNERLQAFGLDWPNGQR